MIGPKDSQIELKVTLAEEPLTIVQADFNNSKNTEKVIKRVFAIQLEKEIHVTTHWFYENWIDHSACDEKKLVQLILEMSKTQGHGLIHCSAGIGRSGVFFITKLFIDKYKETGKVPEEHEIDYEIHCLRKSRPGAVQNEMQRELISKALKYYIEELS